MLDQNHLLTPVNFSEERNLSKGNEMDLVSGKGIITSVTSSMLQQPQLWHVVEILTDAARMLLVIVELLFHSSSTTQRILGTSCWVLNWKGTCLLVEFPTKCPQKVGRIQKSSSSFEKWHILSHCSGQGW